jgi:hypothetical protein
MKKKLPKKKEYPVVSNEKWNDDFKWHESYSDNINEKILEWYNTPYYKIKNK